MFVPAVLKTSCDADSQKNKKDGVDRKYLDATSSQHVENVRVEDFFFWRKYAFQKQIFHISLQKLA